MYHSFERIISDSMMDDSDDIKYDIIMGDDDEWIDTDDNWLDDFQGEEDFA